MKIGYCTRELIPMNNMSRKPKNISLEERMFRFGKSIGSIRSTVDFRRQIILETVYYIICAIVSTIRVVISIPKFVDS